MFNLSKTAILGWIVLAVGVLWMLGFIQLWKNPVY